MVPAPSSSPTGDMSAICAAWEQQALFEERGGGELRCQQTGDSSISTSSISKVLARPWRSHNGTPEQLSVLGLEWGASWACRGPAGREGVSANESWSRFSRHFNEGAARASGVESSVQPHRGP